MPKLAEAQSLFPFPIETFSEEANKRLFKLNKMKQATLKKYIS